MHRVSLRLGYRLGRCIRSRQFTPPFPLFQSLNRGQKGSTDRKRRTSGGDLRVKQAKQRPPLDELSKVIVLIGNCRLAPRSRKCIGQSLCSLPPAIQYSRPSRGQSRHLSRLLFARRPWNTAGPTVTPAAGSFPLPANSSTRLGPGDCWSRASVDRSGTTSTRSALLAKRESWSATMRAPTARKSKSLNSAWLVATFPSRFSGARPRRPTGGRLPTISSAVRWSTSTRTVTPVTAPSPLRVKGDKQVSAGFSLLPT